MCCYPEGVQQLFPKDHLLVEMGVESYLGMPLFDSEGNALGLLAVLHNQPMEEVSNAKLAEELGLREKEASIVRLASLLHDIGKLAVPDEVLFKPGPLNEDEWAIMKQHPTATLHVLGHIRSISDATPAILHHHEHFDGSGYPDGLAGEDIPLASRILLVTDAFDAMTTDRPYRKAMPVEVAIEELERNSGSQFDSTIVEAFLRILARDGAQPLLSLRSAATKTAATVRTG